MSVRAPLKPSAFEAGKTAELGRFKRARRAYGFDEVALVPGRVTINPQEVDSSFQLGALRLAPPVPAAACSWALWGPPVRSWRPPWTVWLMYGLRSRWAVSVAWRCSISMDSRPA